MVPTWLVGVALLGAGMLQPAPVIGDGANRVSGTVGFSDALAVGEVEASTDDGALFAFGPFETTLRADLLRVTVIEKTGREHVVRSGVPNEVMTDFHYGGARSYEQENALLTNVTMRIGGTEDGVLYAYGEPGASTYATRASDSPVVIESVEQRLLLWDPSTETRLQHVMTAPLLGLVKYGTTFPAAWGTASAEGAPSSDDGGDGIIKGPRLPGAPGLPLVPGTLSFVTEALPAFPQAFLDTLEADGEVEAFIHRSVVEVTSDQGDFAWTAEHAERPAADATVGGRGAERVEHFDRYILMSGLARMSVDLEGATGGVAGHSMRYEVDGTLAVSELEGRLAERALKNASVEGKGRFALDVAPLIPDGWVNEPVISTPIGVEVRSAKAPPRPDVRSGAEFDGEATEMTANGLALLNPNALPSLDAEVQKGAGLAVLAGVVLKKLASLLSPLYISNPLDKPSRRIIYDAIGRTGMVHLRELRRLTGVPLGTLGYHVEVLQRFGLVATVRLPGQLVIYQPNPSIPLGRMRDLAVLAHPTRSRIAHLLANGGTFSQRDVSTIAQVSLASASRQLARMGHAGLVVRSGLRNGRYCASPLLRAWYAGRRPEPSARPRLVETPYEEPTLSRV